MASLALSPDSRVRWRESRLKWGSRMEFLLSCVGMAIGIGNVWRFPYMVYKYGGASFLIPYTVLIVTVCVPMYLCEVAIGQFSSSSAISVWKCCPLCKGIGWGMSLVTLYTCVYYNVFVAYTVFFTCASFTSPLPWEGCDNWWNNANCFDVNGNVTKAKAELCRNYTANGTVCPLETAAEQYWLGRVLRLSKNVNEIGALHWDVSLCLLVCWVIVWLVIVRGIRTSGRVVFVIAISPFILLTVLLFRALFLRGSILGLTYLFIPKWKKLLDAKIWEAAAGQMFYSTSLSWGVVTMLSSYNTFDNPCYWDSVFIVLLDYSASIAISVTIFAVIGHASKILEVEVGDIVHVGPGLAFIIYPEVIAVLPPNNMWAVLFFLMMFILGLDSEFAQLESFIANVRDVVPFVNSHTFVFTFILCFLSFFAGLPCASQGGIYILSILDNYTATTNVLLLGFLELVGLMWIYGIKNIKNDFEFMLFRKVSFFYIVSWVAICPFILVGLCFIAWLNFERSSYKNIQLPLKADILGTCLSYSTILPVPCFAIYALVKCYLKGNIKEAWLPEPGWGPENPEIRQAWLFRRMSLDHSSSVGTQGAAEMSSVEF